MKWCFQVEVDESETTMSREELLQVGMNALAEAYEKCGCYFDIGYNPNMITTNMIS